MNNLLRFGKNLYICKCKKYTKVSPHLDCFENEPTTMGLAAITLVHYRN